MEDKGLLSGKHTNIFSEFWHKKEALAFSFFLNKIKKFPIIQFNPIEISLKKIENKFFLLYPCSVLFPLAHPQPHPDIVWEKNTP